MTNNRNFWFALMFGCSLVYLAAIALVYQGQPAHIIVKLAVVLLVAHVLEIPMALNKLKDKNPQFLRLVVLTILFGLLWWVPARRGIIAVR